MWFRSTARVNPGPLADAIGRLLASTDESTRTMAQGAMAAARPGDAAQFNALMRDTFAITMVHAGVKANIIPGDAEATVNVRLLPGSTVEGFAAEMRQAIGDERVEIELITSVPKEEQVAYYRRRVAIASSPVNTALFDAIQRQAKAVWPNSDVAPAMLEGGTDATAWRERNVPVYGIFPYPIAPELFSTFHGHDERVSLEALRQGGDFVHRLLLDVAAKR
jgi:acetylornithine deacetylase/succinyl-diaminopimelate desuccinylase-like protein